jgi:LuxR family maltose regulon positive regulatory protein
VHLALGRHGLAAADLAQARQIARKHNVLRVSFRADLLETHIAVQTKDLVKAESFLEAARNALPGEEWNDRPDFPEKHEYFLMERLRFLIAQGRFEEAAGLAGKAVNSAAAAGRGRHVIEFLVLQSGAMNGLSRTGEALAALERAMLMAEREEIVRPFVSAGREMIPLFRRLKSGEGARTAAEGILSALEDRDDSAVGKTALANSDEPFHRREVQILRLVSEGLRNREIGERLFLSEETVKWYLKRLYCKLCVRTRTEAIASARKLGLLAR